VGARIQVRVFLVVCAGEQTGLRRRAAALLVIQSTLELHKEKLWCQLALCIFIIIHSALSVSMCPWNDTNCESKTSSCS
jgi:hypothetical protein